MQPLGSKRSWLERAKRVANRSRRGSMRRRPIALRMHAGLHIGLMLSGGLGNYVREDSPRVEVQGLVTVFVVGYEPF